MKEKVDKIIKKSKDLNIIKNLNVAFGKTPCEKEIHKGKRTIFNKFLDEFPNVLEAS